MIIRTLDELTGTEREVHSTTWVSKRLLLARDGMGFSFHETVIHAGTTTSMWYKNHQEAVFCVEGEGELENRETGEVHRIFPGMLYGLDQHERHIVRAQTDLRLMCVFNPPVTGREVHLEDGSYPLIREELADASS
ncbi:MAG: ectoine synthase [Candidatus Hydrogenedentes bacterium]|nr:ectoine synthase [Candidatus Hydrogenedentota bacterium]